MRERAKLPAPTDFFKAARNAEDALGIGSDVDTLVDLARLARRQYCEASDLVSLEAWARAVIRVNDIKGKDVVCEHWVYEQAIELDAVSERAEDVPEALRSPEWSEIVEAARSWISPEKREDLLDCMELQSLVSGVEQVKASTDSQGC